MSHLFTSPPVKKHDAACTSISGGLCLGLQNAQNLDATSTALADDTDLSKALGFENKGYLPEWFASYVDGSGKHKGLIWANTWKSLQSRAWPIEELLSKNDLNMWLYGLFLKLALPSNHQPSSAEGVLMMPGLPMLMHSPLNPSTFFRLLVHLSELGYPGHSLSQILVSILTDTVSTSARPTASLVLTPATITTWKTNPKQTFCTAPFFAEMSTLAAIFTRVLPFAVIANTEVVPPINSIRRCTVRLPHLPHSANCSYIAIVFTSFAFKPPPGGWGTDTIRETILNQEYNTKHKDDIIIITTWKYDAPRKLGLFWTREDIARKIDPEY